MAPNIEAKSDFSRHAVNFSAGGQHAGYFDDIESRSNIFGSLDTRLDIRHDFVLKSGVRGGYFEDRQADGKALFEVPPGDLVTPLGAAKPITNATLDAWSSIEKSFNRLAVAADSQRPPSIDSVVSSKTFSSPPSSPAAQAPFCG